jgi:hypothetical protein
MRWRPTGSPRSRRPAGRGRSGRRSSCSGWFRPRGTVWVSDPTWPNHVSILNYLGLPVRTYRYFDAAHRGVDFAGMMHDLRHVTAGDLVLLHGCCHNPTGANLRPSTNGARSRTCWGLGRDAADRHRLPGLRRRARGGCGGHAAPRVAAARGADRGELFEELRHLPRADGRPDRGVRAMRRRRSSRRRISPSSTGRTSPFRPTTARGSSP